jgi:hypothetical protein
VDDSKKSGDDGDGGDDVFVCCPFRAFVAAIGVPERIAIGMAVVSTGPPSSRLTKSLRRISLFMILFLLIFDYYFIYFFIWIAHFLLGFLIFII